MYPLELKVYLVNSALFCTWPLHCLPLHLGRLDIWSPLQNKPSLPIIYKGERKGMGTYDISHLHLIMSLSHSHTHIHTVHTFYVLDFSFLKFPLSAVCRFLISLPLFFGKAHRGVDSMAPPAWSGSFSLSLQQSHLSQDQAAGTQLPLLTLNLCHVGGSRKGFLCEG